jgi:hypothetical protein
MSLADLPAIPAARPGALSGPQNGPLVLVGEVRTGLLRNSTRISGDAATDLLALLPGAAVRRATRPLHYALSADFGLGVHCPLATPSRRNAEGIGTVLARVSLFGGRVVQASARTLLAVGGGPGRLPWSHYVSRLGTIEVSGRASARELADGFLAHGLSTTLDPGAVCNRYLDRIQRSSLLDRTAPFRSRRTRLRFAAVVHGPDEAPDGARGQRTGAFVIEDDTLRTLRLSFASASVPDVLALCEDIALHDWLLTTLTRFLEAGGAAERSDPVRRLGPVVAHLLPLWMPGALVADDLRPLVDALERRAGFSRQWDSLVAHIRDQISLAVVARLTDDDAG